MAFLEYYYCEIKREIGFQNNLQSLRSIDFFNIKFNDPSVGSLLST